MSARYSEATLDGALDAYGVPPLPTPIRSSAGGNVVPLHGRAPSPLAGGRMGAAFEGRTDWPDMNKAAHGGLVPTGFEGLAPERKALMLEAMLARRDANGAYPGWRDDVWACKHAEHLGTPGAYAIALEWSRTSSKFDQKAFDVCWDSFDLYRQGGITVGTLIKGFDTAPWFSNQGTPPPILAAANVAPQVFNASTSGFLQPVRPDQADLREPPWIVHGFAMEGDLTVTSAPPGGAKTVMAIYLQVAMTAGRPSWGGRPIEPRADGQPHRTLLMSAEEDRSRIDLMVAGALNMMNATPVERAAVKANFLIHDARQSGFRIGAPRPEDKGSVCPEENDRGLNELEANATGLSVIVLDTLAAILALANENDNSAVTTVMRRVMKMATRIGCAVILLHHTPKMNNETAASNRGEAGAVRGGGAIIASARIVWTLTPLPVAEMGLHAMMGRRPEAMRRLDPVKLNDAPPPPPILFEVVGTSVTIASGASVSVRAIEFVAMPQAGAGTTNGINTIPPAMLNAAMHAIAAGATVHGVPGVPLIGTSKGNRQAILHITNALQVADPTLTAPLAKAAARDVLNYLMGSARCVTLGGAIVPKALKKTGASNGNEPGALGLFAHWHLAPWMTGSVTPVVLPSTTPTAASAPPPPANAPVTP